MKHMYKYIFSILFTLSLLSCDKAEAQNDTLVYPLDSFSVKSGNSWYHAVIDQNTHTVSIGAIKHLGGITEVAYSLADGASIHPDPSSDGWKWEKSQMFSVTEGDKVTEYEVIFTALEAPEDDGLIFYDEFEVDGIPDINYWSLCPYGTPDWCNQMSESYDQAYVKDGNLVLVGEKKDGKYLAGGIQSKDKFSFSNGRVECRARITRHPDGAFPAIWMMPQTWLYEGWPDCGEIDIMEHIRQEPHIHQTIHTHYRNDLGNEEGTTAMTKCNYWDYVVYAVEWTPDKLTFFVDGKESFSYSNMHLPNESEMMQWPFGPGSSYYLILNMGLGDKGTWAGPMDDANLPAVMEIDWIRVYQLIE